MLARRMAAVQVLALLLPFAGCAKPPVDPVKPFQGNWRERGTGKTVAFDNDQCRIFEPMVTKAGPGMVQVMSAERAIIQIDSTVEPARIDFVYTDGEHQGKTRPGIFA